MAPLAVLLVFLLAGVAHIETAVTNEDIRLAILQIVNVVRSTDDKLERHEYRDRAVGEQLKKGMINIDKRIKLLDPLKGTVSRLDERLAAVETFLMQRDEKKQAQTQKMYEAVLDVQKNLPEMLDQLKNEIIAQIGSHQPPAQIMEPQMSKKDFERVEKEVVGKIDKVSSTIDKMESELNKMREDNRHLNDINSKSNENLEKVKRQLDMSEQLLSRYENRLAEFNKVPELNQGNFKEQDEWKNNFLKALDSQKSYVNDVLNDLRTIQAKVDRLPQKQDLDDAQNTTMEKLEEIKDQAQHTPAQTAQLLIPPIEGLRGEINQTGEDINDKINQLSDIAANLADGFSTNYEKIRKEIQGLGRMEQVVVQTADNVMDTKRRVEYGVHQILAEIARQMKEGAKDINQGISDRFDTFEFSILDEESGALANLTSKIGEDIHQVWRQIGIMHQQMTQSSDTLAKLQNQTDQYVNGSLNVMDNMKGKVGQITGRMKEVDENLNYLMSRLSLVTHEFNQIKTGLGKALDQIRDNFKSVQDKVKDHAPGKHKIASNEIVETN
ncbi:unnamed protein product [Acanthoscelides obtectus]|uniref:Uncharacterized protein n=2 Tax=Acanthoscelides obtectus TaxID=200917 RepID=A0A9P0K2R3_ACAOB|nr:unnamed protein product [Acanthoscelides obtectus]CAK1669768.1 hypothetical protein AOBTE_LOCUS27237 [Acanthoscelides obtectus]